AEWLEVKGVTFVGPLPADIQEVTAISAGLNKKAAAPEAARALLEFLASPAAGGAKTKRGVPPPRGRARLFLLHNGAARFASRPVLRAGRSVAGSPPPIVEIDDAAAGPNTRDRRRRPRRTFRRIGVDVGQPALRVGVRRPSLGVNPGPAVARPR